jgi:predicted ATPase/DNA-binding winged helix-turn-helix (wHTH) protein
LTEPRTPQILPNCRRTFASRAIEREQTFCQAQTRDNPCRRRGELFRPDGRRQAGHRVSARRGPATARGFALPVANLMSAPYCFLAAELHPARRVLLVDGVDCQVGARAFDLLLALIERRDRIVSKEELLELVWPSVVVEENNLQVHISSLRRLVGSSAIATIPGRGYRFVTPLHDEKPASGGLVVAAIPRPELAAATSKTNLPLSRTPLLGRAADVLLLSSLLASHRLVTLVGAGGIGKSALAQAVAEVEVGRGRDGGWWIELAGLADAALLPQTVAQQLGLSALDSATSLQVLVDAIATREMLLVLDNCEHLLEPVALLVDRLLQAAPGLRVLATSQEPLRLQSEQQYRLEPLAVPRDAAVPGARAYGALVLFESRVRAVAPRFELAEADLPLAIDLLRQLDGLPLAIELAAARVPLLGLRTLHARIRERFRLLTAGARTALRRHQTLRAAMDWSYSLLSEEQRAVFRRLGVFSSGFTMELAQAVCTDDAQDEWAVVEQLSSLIDKSLVAVDASEPVRYRLLESPRAFAIEQLGASGETAALLDRHATAMLQFLRRADDGNMDSTLRSDEYAALVLPELDNLRAAYAWAAGEAGDAAVATGLAAHAGPLIDYSSEFAEWLLAQRPHVRPGAIDENTQARFWRAIAAPNMFGTLTLPELLEAARLATAAYRSLRRPRRLFSALRLVAMWSRRTGEVEEAQLAIDEAAALIKPDWAAEFRIVVLRFRAWISREEGAYDAAIATYREALQLANEAGDWRLEVIERGNVCDLLWQLGRHDEAAQSLTELIELQRLRSVSDYELVEALSMQVGLLGEIGRIKEATAAAIEALPVMRRMPKFRFEPCAQLLWRLGRPKAAARVLGASEARERDGRETSQGNEKRIALATLSSLQVELAPAQLEAEMALGERLGHSDVCALLADALAGAGAHRDEDSAG